MRADVVSQLFDRLNSDRTLGEPSSIDLDRRRRRIDRRRASPDPIENIALIVFDVRHFVIKVHAVGLVAATNACVDLIGTCLAVPQPNGIHGCAQAV
jgi:hypothetical protein